MELIEVAGWRVRDGAEFHSALAPIHPLIAELRPGAGRNIALGGRPDKHVDNVFAAAVNERSDGAPVKNVQAAPLQRESIIREITHGRREIEFAVEPRLYGVLIRGGYVREMPGL